MHPFEQLNIMIAVREQTGMKAHQAAHAMAQ